MTRIETIGNATRIYSLCEFPSMTPHYVGKTVQSLRLRLNAHMQVARKAPRLPVGRWLAKREREGRMVCINWIETVDAGKDWAARERHWIAKLREDGEILLNLTDGGEGLAGLVFSKEHKQKISAALRTGATFACEVCATPFWRKLREINAGDCRFCSRECYAIYQRGRSKPVPALCIANGVAAAKAMRNAMTHCKRGHLLSGDNLFRTSAGSRGCKACRKLHKEAYRARSR